MGLRTDPRPGLAVLGQELAERLCLLNGVAAPDFYRHEGRLRVRACAYYRPGIVKIGVAACARPAGEAMSRLWSFPGYVVDRTPYGVTMHELGHHFDHLLSGGGSRMRDDFSRAFVREHRVRPITSYAPNDAEIFAEVFKLFGTNPGLLEAIRPRAFEALAREVRPAVDRPWRAVLMAMEAPGRIIKAAENKARRPA